MPDQIRRRLILSLIALPCLARCRAPVVDNHSEKIARLTERAKHDSTPKITQAIGDKETHGATITLTGSNFGKKENAAPILYDYCHEAIEYGRRNTFARDYPLTDGMDLAFLEANDIPGRVYHSISGEHQTVAGRASPKFVTTSFNHRHPYMKAHYLCRQNSFFGEPEIYNNEPTSFTPPGNRQLYAAWWVKMNCYLNDSLGFTVTDVQGKIDRGLTPYDKGERFTIPGARPMSSGTGVPSKDTAGNVIDYFVDEFGKPWVYLDFDIDKPRNFRFMEGRTIQFSQGATAKIEKIARYDRGDVGGKKKNGSSIGPEDVNFWWIGHGKISRIWDVEGGNGGDIRFTITALKRINVGNVDKSKLAYNDESFDYTRLTPHEWHLIENVISKDGYWELWIDLKREALTIWDPETVTSLNDHTETSPTVKLIGLHSNSMYRAQAEIGEFYQDKTLQRIMVANSPALESATRWELQPPLTWEDNWVTFSMFRGSLLKGEQLYVFITNQHGVYSKAGTEIH